VQQKSEKNLTFPERLKNARKKLNLTQEGLAERMGMAGNYIYLLESGKKPFPLKLEKNLKELELAAGIPPDLVEAIDEFKTIRTVLDEREITIVIRWLIDSMFPHQLLASVNKIAADAELSDQAKVFWTTHLTECSHAQSVRPPSAGPVVNSSYDEAVRDAVAAIPSAEKAAARGIPIRPQKPKAAGTSGHRGGPSPGVS
jgi:transcriptional regulator with XRE-family HTH domain